MRPWGEDAGLLERAGADLDELRRLERGLERDLAGLPRAGGLDAHVHLGRDRDGHRLDAAGLIADLDRWGLAAAVCFPANEPGEDGTFAAANDAVLAAARRHPARIVPFCRVDPLHPGARDEIARAAGAGARGLKLHPVAQRFRPEAPEAVAAVRDATALGWPVMVHAGFGARPLAGPVGELLDGAPGARLILAHGGRGDARALAARLDDWPGVLLDTSLAALADVASLPPERLVFGSDRPYGDHATALRLVALAARAAGWTPTESEAVMGGTLRAWLP